MPFLPPHGVDPGGSGFLRRTRRPLAPGTPGTARRPGGPPAVDERTHCFHTGVHRLCTPGNGCCPASLRARPRSASLQVRSRFGRTNGGFGGRLTDGVGPRAVTLTSDAERRRR